MQLQMRSFSITCRRATTRALLLGILSVATTVAQPGDRRLDIRARVLDLIFRSELEGSLVCDHVEVSSSCGWGTPAPYLSKLTLRFGDTDTQLVVVVYPVYPAHAGGRAEIICYSLLDMGNGDLSKLISKMVAQNPNVTDRDIAAKVKVSVTRSPIDYEALNRSLKDLEAVRISPILKSRVAVDEYSEFDFWYDGGQESVHYTITGPFKGDPQDRLVQWMIRFRAHFPVLVRRASALTPSKSQ
jgi:hypothetical protein